MKVAAIASWILGLGCGLPAVPAIQHFAAGGEVWTFMGFPTYGDGPFEAVGLGTTVALLVAFLAVCVAEVVIGALLWAGRRSGVALSFGLLP